MKTFICTMDDQGHVFTKKVRAIDEKEAIKQAKVFSYARVVDCEEENSGSKTCCPHCGKEIKLS